MVESNSVILCSCTESMGGGASPFEEFDDDGLHDVDGRKYGALV